MRNVVLAVNSAQNEKCRELCAKLPQHRFLFIGGRVRHLRIIHGSNKACAKFTANVHPAVNFAQILRHMKIIRVWS
jgi:hypothetical protein